MELAIVAQEAAGAVAQVERFAVEAHAAVEARVGQTLVTVDTALPVKCHHLRLATTLVFVCARVFLCSKFPKISDCIYAFKSDYYHYLLPSSLTTPCATIPKYPSIYNSR